MGDLKQITVAVVEHADMLGVEHASTGPAMTFRGRAAWALGKLIAAGTKGCTPIDTPGPRWSHYVFMLRKAGLPVQTHTENHGGSYSGHHARYQLAAPVRVLEEVRS